MSDIATSTIARQAFRELGLRPLSSYEDGSPEAIAAAQEFPHARDIVLESYDWAFARATVRLPQVPDAPAIDEDLPYAYQLPADSLALRHVLGGARWRREGGLVRSDLAECRAILTRRLTHEPEIPATARHAIALQLALQLAGTYVATRAKRADLENALANALDVARRNDRVSASQHQADGRDPIEATDWPGRVVL